MKIGYKTDKGKFRERNEDAYFVDQTKRLFIVADGMGGYQGGEIASHLAVQTISKFLSPSSPASFLEKTSERKELHKSVLKAIQQSIAEANEEIHRKASEESQLNGMGTTIVLALFCNDLVYISHVGDSRAYLIRNNTIKQLTKDHSLVTELIKKGVISKEEAQNHHLRNIITRALGKEKDLKVDIIPLSYKKGDYLLLCTDGLTDVVEDEEIKDIILKAKEPVKACNRLVNSANRRGGKDNVTVIIIKMDEGGR